MYVLLSTLQQHCTVDKVYENLLSGMTLPCLDCHKMKILPPELPQICKQVSCRTSYKRGFFSPRQFPKSRSILKNLDPSP